MSLYPIRRGCGSWECDCGEPHTLPFKVKGKSGSVTVTLLPAAKGLGLVAGDTAKVVLTLAGIKDSWSKSIGHTSTPTSFAFATFNALKQTMKIMTPSDWVA
jgi:small subunit ribosomal protein S5